MKRFAALLLASMTVFSMAVPALAAKSDKEIRVNCSKCGRAATRLMYYSKEKVARSEKKHENGKTYIRFEMVVPNSVFCDTCGKYTGERYVYMTEYQFMGNDSL